MLQEPSNIVDRNKGLENMVNAAAKYGLYGLGGMYPKRLSLLVTADFHHSEKQLHSAITYLDTMDALDAGICLGDMAARNLKEDDGTWYINAVKQTKKPFYTVIGNHDCGNGKEQSVAGSKRQVFEQFIMPLRSQMGMPELDKTYYVVNYDEYKISLIVLDNYDAPDTLDDKNDFIISRGVEMIGQEQVEWLQTTLLNIPEDYHVMVVRHGITEPCLPIECNWTQSECQIRGSEGDCITPDLVTDLIDAWIHGKAIQKEYFTEKYSMLQPITVNVDFAPRGQGIFIGYLIGHTHIDWLGVCEKYPEQQMISVAASANDDWQNFASDLPRVRGTRAEDCITVLSVDTENRCIHLIRVGSNITCNMIDRTHTSLSY